MAIPSVGGMALQLITLFIAPCIYCWVKEWQLKRRLRRSNSEAVAHAATAAGGKI
jgi:hypothetical protein